MNVEVTKDNVTIIGEYDKPHQEEYKMTICHFTFDEFTSQAQNKVAVFTILTTGEATDVDIIDNECAIPNEVLKHELETIKLGVYGYDVEEVSGDTVLKQRYSPSYDTFVVASGSYVEGAKTAEMITPSQYDIYSAKLQEGLNEIDEAIANAERLDIDAEKVGKVSTITITKQDGSQEQVTLEDGMGLDYNWQGTSLGVKREDEEVYQYTDLQGPVGPAGAIKFEIVQQLPTQDIKTDTIYLVPYDIVTVQELPSTGAHNTIYIVSSTNKRYVYESNQWIEISSDNKYAEYLYVNGQWEELGGLNVDVDLSDYYKKEETYSKEETNTLLSGKQNTINNDNKLSADLVNDTNSTNKFTSTSEKSTWNAKYDKPETGIPKTDLSSDVQTSLGKADTAIQSSDLTDYVKNTDYSSAVKGGVVKVSTSYGTEMTSNGYLKGTGRLYSQYINDDVSLLISKYTLENVITGKGLVSNTDYANSSTGGVVKTNPNGFGLDITNGQLYPTNISYGTYASKGNTFFISKGTLEAVITGKNLETANNKVTSLSSASTDTQYPSAKCVYDIVGNVETLLTTLDIGNGVA